MTCTKVSYSSLKFANDDIERIQKKSTRDKIPIRAYKCKFCSCFHLTSSVPFTDELIMSLREQIVNLKSQVESLTHAPEHLTKSELKEIRIDERIQQLNRTINSQAAKITHLRSLNTQLLTKNLHLQQELDSKIPPIIAIHF